MFEEHTKNCTDSFESPIKILGRQVFFLSETMQKHRFSGFMLNDAKLKRTSPRLIVQDWDQNRGHGPNFGPGTAFALKT